MKFLLLPIDGKYLDARLKRDTLYVYDTYLESRKISFYDKTTRETRLISKFPEFISRRGGKQIVFLIN